MNKTENLVGGIELRGVPIGLSIYEGAGTITNRHFKDLKIPDFEKIYLPHSAEPFAGLEPTGEKTMLADDNRSAIDRLPCLRIDGTDFYLSVKGIGSTTSPFSRQLFRKEEVSSLVRSSGLRERILSSRQKDSYPRYLTGELWSRGCPYGAQGLEFATIAMRAAEMAGPGATSIHGFRIAPLVKINTIPELMQEKFTQVFWYRRFKQTMVQETRLLPSNVRIYFHSDWTVGDDTGELFDFFGIDDNDKAMNFLMNFVRSGMAILTLFVRTMQKVEDGAYRGLDFYDVWLDKDAVLAPDGTIYWADLEGLQEVTVRGSDRRDVEFNLEELMEHQIYRSLYEFMYAYEQIDRERVRRFGHMNDRKVQFEFLLREAIVHDEVLGLHRTSDSLELEIGNILGQESLTRKFTILDY
ncbi:MAG: hypothetical protein JRN68_03670 [Nitrososphaerota archaeon]|jgi:hypothetical protein|nr:hypothetical protein [Nitrososphaerota archaeon]